MRASLPVKLGDRNYLIDLAGFSYAPMRSTRQSVDLSREPSDATFDHEGVWKRTVNDFVLGSGQRYVDHEEESNRRQWRRSKGIDPWERRTLQLLPDVELSTTFAPSGSLTGRLVAATTLNGSEYLYAAAGSIVRRFNGTTWATCTTPAVTEITELVVIGGFVYLFAITGVVSRAPVGGTVFAQVGTTAIAAHAAGTGGGRLVAASKHELFEITAAGTKEPIYSHFGGSSGFIWTGVLGAPNGIYVWGDDGAKSHVYLLSVVDATGALAAPYPVSDLEPGVFVTAMVQYGGVLVMATNQGVRLATINGSGFLGAAKTIEDPGECHCLAVDRGFIWFGWSGFDATSCGLGRMFPSKFTDDYVPAFASDLMADVSGLTLPSAAVTAAVARYDDRTWFLVTDGEWARVYAEHPTQRVAQGQLWSGGVTFTTSELKAIHSVEGAWDALPAGAGVSVDILDGIDGTAHAGVVAEPGTRTGRAPLAATLIGEEAEVRVTLTRSTDGTQSPRFHRWTVRAMPLPYRTSQIVLPVIIASNIDWASDGQQMTATMNPAEEFAYLKGLEQSRTLVWWTFGDHTELVRVESVGITRETATVGVDKWTPDMDWAEGTWQVVLFSVEPESYVA